MSIGVSVFMWIALVEAGASCEVVAGSWDRGCMVDGLLTLGWFVAGAVTGAGVREQVGLWVVFMAVLACGVEPEGRQRRLAALASSAGETSWLGAGMA